MNPRAGTTSRGRRVQLHRKRQRRAVALALALLMGTASLAAARSLGHWTSAGSLSRARAWATATVLPDGHVLVVGGFGAVGPRQTGPMASAELYDTAANRWSQAPPIVSPRFEATATLLRNGTVLVAGGANETVGPLSSAMRYDPAGGGGWVRAADLHTARTDATASLLADGRVLVAGGIGPRGNVLRSAEVYDPSRDVWTAAASMHLPRYHQTATVLPDGRVLIAGGERDAGGSKILYRSAEIYEPSRNRWTTTGSMVVPRANHVAARLADGRVLVAGGGELGVYGAGAEIFNPRTGRWRRAASMPVARAFATAATLADGHVLVAGGFTGQADTALAERYDPAHNRWLPAGRMRGNRGHQAAVILPDGRVLVIGGQRYNGPFLRTAETYQP